MLQKPRALDKALSRKALHRSPPPAFLALLLLLAGLAAGRPAAPADPPARADLEHALEAALQAPASSLAFDLGAACAAGGDLERLGCAWTLHWSETAPSFAALRPSFERMDLAAVRFAIEAAVWPLPAAAEPLVGALAARPEVGARVLAAELAARLEPARAEPALLELAAAARNDRELQAACDGLKIAGSERAAAFLLERCAEPLPATRRKAQDAVARLRARLLDLGDADGALRVAQGRVAALPGDFATELGAAALLGITLRDAGGALPRLERLLQRFPLRQAGAEAREQADALRVRAIVEHLAGEHATALASCAASIELLESGGGTPSTAEEAALSLTRSHLVRALLLIDGTPSAPLAARAQLLRAARAAPFRRDVCLLDAAFDGIGGANAVLAAFARYGREASRATFYALLADVLDGDEAGGTLGYGFVDGLPPGGEAERQDRLRPKSWSALWRAYAEIADGRLDDAARHAARLGERLERTELFNNRWLQAEARLAQAIALSRAPDGAEALEPAKRALEQLTAVAKDAREGDLEDVRGRFESGAPPYRNPLRDRLAAAHALLAEIHGALLADPAHARESAAAAVRADPFDDRARILLAIEEARAGETARAQRVLESLPRLADSLEALARLAAALGRRDEARALFAQHLAWNARTEEKRAAETAWGARFL